MASVPGGGTDGRPDSGEIVNFGRPVRRRNRWTGSLVLACLAAAAVAVVVRSGGPRGVPTPPPATVIDVGHPILGVRAGWQLIGIDGNGVVAIQFARGRIVRTTIPQIAADGIVSLVTAPGGVLVRPLDNVTGYVVPDGEPARPLTGVLAHGGYLLPGPTPAQQWLDSRELSLVLVGPGGKRERAHLPELALLSATQAPIISDGRGGFIFTGASGTVYDAYDHALRTINALPIAVGPLNWLGLQCDKGDCHDVVMSAATGVSRALPGPASYLGPWPWRPLPGLVSPDGATAAIVVSGDFDGQASLDLVSLISGAGLRVPVPVARDTSSQCLAWSPDSRWLFVVTAHGTLAVVDARTGLPQHINLGLSGLSQIVIRPAAG